MIELADDFDGFKATSPGPEGSLNDHVYRSGFEDGLQAAKNIVAAALDDQPELLADLVTYLGKVSLKTQRETHNSEQEMSRTIKVRPNPPIIPAPKKNSKSTLVETEKRRVNAVRRINNGK